MTNKHKIINDPIHGFINLPYKILYDLMEHPYLQRLRRISQTGLLSLVYPGAQHSRFHHALGAMHLMFLALNNLKLKQIDISEEEEKAALIAILLHDIGHGPYSHALESILMTDMHHEKLSLNLMERLNAHEFLGQLSMAIEMFKGQYHRPFFNQLISSQLDMDRLDYLKRDSFFTGVAEGNINAQRIISMINVCEDELVVEAKGIYSVESFLSSRMFMYWQVYFHKTNCMAESQLIKLLQRAKQIYPDSHLEASPALAFFLGNKKRGLDDEILGYFSQLDDSDLMYSLKLWQNHPDKIISYLSKSIVQRQFGKSILSSLPFDDLHIIKLINQCHRLFGSNDGALMVEQKKISLLPYDTSQPIKLWHKDGRMCPIEQSEHQILSHALSQKNTKYMLYYPKEILEDGF